MINKDTILSVHDDRLTLLQWLKKVEDVLEKDALKSISYVTSSTEGATQYGYIHLEFNDGTFKDSPEFSVASPTALQEAIDKMQPQAFVDFFAHSPDIIIDVAEDGTHVEMHLDQEIAGKIDRALLHPVSNPTEEVLVGLNASNAQTSVKIGAGLLLEKGTLKQLSGQKIYRHVLSFAEEKYNIVVFNASDAKITQRYDNDGYYYGATRLAMYYCSYKFNSTGQNLLTPILDVYFTSGNLSIYYLEAATGQIVSKNIPTTPTEDEVVAL